MLKYVNTMVTFSEVPDEIALCINITGCKIGCKNCHSPYLAEDIGKELNIDSLHELISSNKGITCVSFMGGDSNPKEIDYLAFRGSRNLKNRNKHTTEYIFTLKKK